MIDKSPLAEPLEPQDVQSGASSYEAAGSNLNSFAQGVSQGAGAAVKSYSQNLVTGQLNNIQQTIRGATQSIYQDYSPANLEAQSKLVDSVVQQTRGMSGLLPEDQRVLNDSLSSLSSGFYNLAARRSLKNGNKLAAIDYYNNLPDTIRTITQLSGKDPQVPYASSDQLMQDLDDQTKSLVAQGAIPVTAYAKVVALKQSIAQRQEAIQSLQGELGSHQQNVDSQYGLDGAYSQQPNPYTNVKQSIYQGAYSVQDAQSAILSSRDPLSTITSLIQNNNITTKDIAPLSQYVGGVMDTKAKMATWNQLQSIKNTSKNTPLNSFQKGQRDAANYVISQIQNGNFFNWYNTESPEGQKSLSDLNDSINSVQQSTLLSPSAKVDQVTQLQRNYDISTISYANSVGIPDKYVSLTTPDSEISQKLSAGFRAGQDPADAINTLKSFGSFAPFYLNNLPPRQQAMYNLATLSPQDGSLFVMGNQVGFTPPPILDVEDKNISDGEIRASLLSQPNIQNYMSFIPKQMVPYTLDGLVNSFKYGCNAASCNKEIMARHIDSLMPSDYVSGTTQDDNYASVPYSFLREQLPQFVSTDDAARVANYVKNKAMDQLIFNYQHPVINGVPQAAPSEQQLVNYKNNLENGFMSLRITNSPTGSIMAIEPVTGRVIYKVPLTNNLISAAEKFGMDNYSQLQSTELSQVKSGTAMQRGFGW